MKNYMIAVCDILGFKECVKRTPINGVVTDVLGWLSKALHHSIHKNNFPKQIPTLNELQTNEQIGLAWFSDTIILYTHNDTDECIRNFITTLSFLLFETMLNPNVRIRCGVSYGQMIIDAENSIYVGKPLIDAYELERDQVWSGGALTDAATQRIPIDARSGQNINWWVVPYYIPLKDEKFKKTLAIDWTWGIHTQQNFLSWSKNSNKPTESDWITRPDICKKWQMTKSFHDKVCVFCKKREHMNVY